MEVSDFVRLDEKKRNNRLLNELVSGTDVEDLLLRVLRSVNNPQKFGFEPVSDAGNGILSYVMDSGVFFLFSRDVENYRPFPNKRIGEYRRKFEKRNYLD